MQLVKWQSWDLKLCLSGSAILTYSSILKMHVFMIWISSLDWQFFECRGQLLVILCIFWIKKKWMHISWLMPLTSFSWFLSLGQANWIWVERRGVLIKDESLSQNGPELWDLQRTALRSNGLTPEGAAWGHSWLCFWRLPWEELSLWGEKVGIYLSLALNILAPCPWASFLSILCLIFIINKMKIIGACNY